MSLNVSQQKERAEQMVERFVRRFQPSYRLLAYHAALPLVLTPELVNFLRVQFLQGIVPWVAEVDLLLSDLCKQVGYELYAMDTAVRAYLLEEMKRKLGEGRMQEVARLLISYVKYLYQNNPYINPKELQAQQWAAMVYLEEPRQQTVREIAEAFQVFGTSATGQELINKADLARLAGITQELAPQLSAYQDLVDYAALISRVLTDATQVNLEEVSRTYEVLPGLGLHVPHELLPDIQVDPSRKAKITNGTIMQYFHWYLDPDLILWNEVKNKAQELANAGFTAVWLPPAYKGFGGSYDMGYGVYDMYDLGEFDQKGSVRTRYGDRKQYLDAIQTLHSYGIQVYSDTALNHRVGGDEIEVVKATPFSWDDRLNPQGEMREIEAYTHFAFPGRQGKYSDFEWHWWHFNAVDWDARSKESNTIYLFEGKQFDDYVSTEKGNFDYLIGCNLDYQNPEVREEVIRWGKWYLDTTDVDGFRLDAIKHISARFFPQWIDEMERHAGKELFVVGEYWHSDVGVLDSYVDTVGDRMSLFDIPLHYNFYYASQSSSNYDMSTILDGTMMQKRPSHAVTFVEDDSSQPLRALESAVKPWFKPMAYAIILLRAEGYPCVFYADYYGAEYADRGSEIHLPSHRWIVDKLLYARQNFAYGGQYDYFNDKNIIGWTRLGNKQHPKAMAVIMSNNAEGSKWMEVGRINAKFNDITENITESVYTNQDGWGEFSCNGGSVSVWVEQELNEI